MLISLLTCVDIDSMMWAELMTIGVVKMKRYQIKQDELSGNHMIVDTERGYVVDMYNWIADAKMTANHLNKYHAESESKPYVKTIY